MKCRPKASAPSRIETPTSSRPARDSSRDVEMAAGFDLVSCNPVRLRGLCSASASSRAERAPEPSSRFTILEAGPLRGQRNHESPADCRGPSPARFPSAQSSRLSGGDAPRRAGWEPGCTRHSFDRADRRRRHPLARRPGPQQRSLARARKRDCVNRRPPSRQPVGQDCGGGIASRHQNRRVDFIGQSKGAPRRRDGVAGHAGDAGRAQRQTRGRLRHGNDLSAHAREHDPRRRAPTAGAARRQASSHRPRVAASSSISPNSDSTLPRARARGGSRLLHRGGMRRLDRAERLPRDSRAPRQLGLREIARHSRPRHSVVAGCHDTCQSPLKWHIVANMKILRISFARAATLLTLVLAVATPCRAQSVWSSARRSRIISSTGFLALPVRVSSRIGLLRWSPLPRGWRKSSLRPVIGVDAQRAGHRQFRRRQRTWSSSRFKLLKS